MIKRLPHRIAAAALALMLLSGMASADDNSYSQVVKHIKSNYHARQQGFFGAMMLARFAVKIIKPAGVKNFKAVLLKDLDFTEAPGPKNGQFHSFIQGKIDPMWTPLVQYSSPREKQWSYVYIAREKEDVKLLGVTLQQKEALVL